MPTTPVTAVLPNALGLSSEAYEVMLDAVKHYTTMARSAIKTPQSLSNSPAKIPPGQQRRVACTHLTMKRQYGGYRCMVCRRIPEIGWVYMCSQDEAEMIEDEQDRGIWDDGGTDLKDHWLERGELGATTKPEPPSVTQLSPWIEKAILDGHYTPEQELLLRLQKQNVNEKIAAATQQFYATETETAASLKQSPSVEANSCLPSALTNQDSGTPQDEILPSGPKPVARIFPYCEHRACHNCRSTFRDRTWQRLGDIFEDSTEPYIDFENDERPLSSPAIVANLGLHEPKRIRPHRPLLHAFDNMATRYPSSGKRAPEIATVDVADQEEMSESKGFRNNIKRAFRDMLMGRRDSMASTSTRSSVSTARPSRHIRRHARLREESSTDDPMEFDLGMWERRSRELLEEASHVRLPGHDGHDGLDAQAEEVNVENGVAVTEEGVNTGTADIIMSV